MNPELTISILSVLLIANCIVTLVYGPKHSTFRKEETKQSMADAVRLANTIFIRYTHSGFQHSTQETYTK